MKKEIFKITENMKIASDVYRLRLCGDCGDVKPGQFVMVELPEFFLRRPISVCDVHSGNILTLIYKVIGGGTEKLTSMGENERLSLLLPLGNGFELKKTRKPLLVGGGVGVPPLLYTAKELLKLDTKPVAVLGFNSVEDVFLARELTKFCESVHVTTVDGTHGTQGFVTDIVSTLDFDYFYACGPLPMLKALEECTHVEGQLSYEERMGCGFGACMGCTCHKKDGKHARVCKEGPVFYKGELDIII